MRRKDFIDGITLMGFSLILTGLVGTITEKNYLFGFIKPAWMVLGLSLGAIFCLIAGAMVLFGKGRFCFVEE